MKKGSKNIVLIAIMALVVVASLVVLRSCYYCDSDDTSEYAVFRDAIKRKDKELYEFIPDVGKDVIEAAYLYYNDFDLIDSYYTVYLNCQYSREEYNKEKERLEKVLKGAYVDMPSFEYPSLAAEAFMDRDYLRYSYALFCAEEHRIIYVALFDIELNGKSTNIPDKYLPKNLVVAREQTH